MRRINVKSKVLGGSLAVCLLVSQLLVGLQPTGSAYASAGQIEVAAAADTYADGTNPGTNYGSAGSVVIKGSADPSFTRKAYMKFDFGTYSGSGVGSAFLKLYHSTDTSSQPTPVNVYGLTDDAWSESGLTWNNQPSATGQVLLGTVTVTHPGWYTIDVTSFVSGQLTDKTATFKLEDVQNTSTYLRFSTRESANAPVLEIVPVGEKDEAELLMDKWVENHLTGGDLDSGDADLAAWVAALESEAQGNWDTMDQSSARTYLWSDYPGSSSAHITKSYRRLEQMTLAYTIEGSTLQGNSALKADIIEAMDWIYDNWYNAYTAQIGNWWDFEIGTPRVLAHLTMLLYHDLSVQQKLNYMNAIYYYQPDPRYVNAVDPVREKHLSTAANRLDTSKGAILRGLITHSEAQIAAGAAAIVDALDYVTTGDGFYPDGSFIQHSTIAYTAAYGQVLLGTAAELLQLLAGSTWEVTDPKANNVYSWVLDSFEPIIYKGAAMDMVRGRKIAEPATDHLTGMDLASMVAILAQAAPAPYDTTFKQMVKDWLESDTTFNPYAYGNLNIQKILALKQIDGNAAITPRAELLMTKVYANMDRVVHRRPGWAFGLSMHSTRIANYESLQAASTNLKGWYTGSGMTYLYNSDLTQYTYDFWPTVNKYRLPGTTVDTVTLLDREATKKTSTKSWVGGTTLQGNYGTAGMDLKQYNTTLSAKKSWFMFDNEIVNLGAGITSSDNRTIETIVENRKLNAGGSNALTVNGNAKSTSLGWSETMTGVNWAHLAGSAAGADLGYYFPTAATLKGLREARTGSYAELDVNGSTDPLAANYMTLWFDHGANPSGKVYNYVVLPGMSSSQVSAYAANPEIAILANNSSVQAVKETGLNLIGANFWTNTTKTVDMITSHQQASVMTREQTDSDVEIAVSDPTMKNTGTIELELGRSASGVVWKDPEVTVTQLSPTIKLSVNVNGAKGQTFRAKFDLN